MIDDISLEEIDEIESELSKSWNRQIDRSEKFCLAFLDEVTNSIHICVAKIFI